MNYCFEYFTRIADILQKIPELDIKVLQFGGIELIPLFINTISENLNLVILKPTRIEVSQMDTQGKSEKHLVRWQMLFITKFTGADDLKRCLDYGERIYRALHKNPELERLSLSNNGALKSFRFEIKEINTENDAVWFARSLLLDTTGILIEFETECLYQKI